LSLLEAKLARALSELLIGELAVKRHHARGKFLKFLREDNSSLRIFMPLKLFNATGRALHQVGEADAELDDPFIVMMIEQFRHYARVIQELPKLVSAASVIVAHARRSVAGVAPDDDHLHPAPQIVRKSTHKPRQPGFSLSWRGRGRASLPPK